MSKSSPPPPPDYVGAAQQQGMSNIQSAIVNTLLNRPNEYNPYGSRQWFSGGGTVPTGGGGTATIPNMPMNGMMQGSSLVPGSGGGLVSGTSGSTTLDPYRKYGVDPLSRAAGIEPKGLSNTVADFFGGGKTNYTLSSPGTPDVNVPQMSSVTSLTPEGQAIFDKDTAIRIGLGSAAEGALGRAGSALERPMDFAGLPSNTNEGVTDAMFRRSQRMLDPRWQQAEDAERTRLANAGFSVGNEGFTKAIGNFGREKEAAYQDATDRALLAGQTAGMDQRRQAIQEMLVARQQPLSELSSIRTGAAPNLPQFQPYGGTQAIQGAPLSSAAAQQGAYGSDLYNAQTGQQNAAMQGLFGLGAAYLMSDRRLKRDVHCVGTHPLGIGIYSFRYLWSDAPQVGVMADELLPIRPDLVAVTPSGYLAVAYGGL